MSRNERNPRDTTVAMSLWYYPLCRHATNASTRANVFCVVCGVENPEHAKYCSECGKPLARVHAHVNEPASGPSSSAASPPQTPFAASPPPTAKSAITQLPRIEIKPKSRRNGIFGILGCSMFTIGGVLMLATGEPLTMFAGLVSVVFFGGGGLLTIPKLMRRKISFVLTSDGLQQVALVGSAYIAWSDVESVGVASMSGTHLVGVRLKTYDRYIASMTHEMADYFRKTLPALKLIARASSVLEIPVAVKLWSALKGEEDPGDLAKSFGKVGTLVESMLWSRQKFGYDVLWGWSDLDRSANDFAKLLDQYREFQRNSP